MEVTRGIKYKISATFIEEEYYNTPSIINIINKNNNIDQLYCLLGFLNSRLMTWYHLKKHSKALASTSIPKILVGEIRNIPLKLKLLESMALTKLTTKILSLKTKKPTIDTNQLEIQIDQLVYQLYNLTPEEIKIVEGN